MFNVAAFLITIAGLLLFTTMMIGAVLVTQHRWLPVRIAGFVIAVVSFASIMALVVPTGA